MAYAHAAGMIERYLRTKRILVVDDERELASMVEAILHGARFEHVTLAHSGEEAYALVEDAYAHACTGGHSGNNNAPEPAFHLFVLDVMMPGMDGFQLLGQLREHPASAHAAALFLTAKDEPYDRVRGLTLGADDYLVKPFLPQELVLRIAAILRRCYEQESPLLQLAACSVSFDTAEVVRTDGTTVALTAKEHEILGVLARNIGRIVTIDALCEACWGTSFGYDNSLMAHIRRLREKIEANPSKPVSLITVKGLGYKLVARS